MEILPRSDTTFVWQCSSSVLMNGRGFGTCGRSDFQVNKRWSKVLKSKIKESFKNKIKEYIYNSSAWEDKILNGTLQYAGDAVCWLKSHNLAPQINCIRRVEKVNFLIIESETQSKSGYFQIRLQYTSHLHS
jgi:hypothetical protein